MQQLRLLYANIDRMDISLRKKVNRPLKLSNVLKTPSITDLKCKNQKKTYQNSNNLQNKINCNCRILKLTLLLYYGITNRGMDFDDRF